MLCLLDMQALQNAAHQRPVRPRRAQAAAVASAAVLTSLGLAVVGHPAAARRARPWAAGRLRDAQRRCAATRADRKC